jgi:hypothetical protein
MNKKKLQELSSEHIYIVVCFLFVHILCITIIHKIMGNRKSDSWNKIHCDCSYSMSIGELFICPNLHALFSRCVCLYQDWCAKLHGEILE